MGCVVRDGVGEGWEAMGDVGAAAGPGFVVGLRHVGWVSNFVVVVIFVIRSVLLCERVTV